MAYYMVFKWFPNDPKRTYYEIIKEYENSNYVWGSPLYEILEYFDTRKEAQEYIKKQV
tara:strand:+ start:2615 stop:2788 length:174 start_codon:yes stop_codon:yes gene_type:complete